MVTAQKFRLLCLSFPETVELPHFELTSFRVSKKIFATVSEEKLRAMLKLSLVDQSVFCAFDKKLIYPVPGSWGMKGCTYFELRELKIDILKDGLTQAYRNVAPKSLCQNLNLKDV